MASGRPGPAAGSRIGAFDALRGLSVVSMVLFHLCYDLRYIEGVPLDWFAPPLQDVWRASISWTFLAVAGCMCTLSRSTQRRAGQYGAVALAVWAATTVAAVDTPVSFGIIYCMAACTLVAWLLGRAGLMPRGYAAAAVLFVGFLCLLELPQGRVGLGPASAAVPAWPYETGLLSWLGMPGPGFSSGDYYPLLPYLLVYLAGAALGGAWAERGYPSWAREMSAGPLNLVGRHALLVYVAHQPLLLAACSLLP